MKRIAMIDIIHERMCEEWRVYVMPDGGKPIIEEGLSWSEVKKIVKENIGISISKPERMNRLDRFRSIASFVIGESDDGSRKAFRI